MSADTSTTDFFLSPKLLVVAGLSLAAGVATGAVLYHTWSSTFSAAAHEPPEKQNRSRDDGICDGILSAIGGTPLLRLRSLSQATGCEILGKAEFLNPGGSVKDRVALRIIEEAMESGKLTGEGLVR